MRTPDNRRHQRYPLAVRIELEHGYGLTRDVSVGGVYFETVESLLPASSISFTLVLEQLNQDSPWSVRCHGTVLRIEPLGDRVGIAASIQVHQIAPSALEGRIPH